MCMILFDVGVTLPSLPADETIPTIKAIRSMKTRKNDRIKPTIEAKTNLKNSFIFRNKYIIYASIQITDTEFGYLLHGIT